MEKHNLVMDNISKVKNNFVELNVKKHSFLGLVKVSQYKSALRLLAQTTNNLIKEQTEGIQKDIDKIFLEEKIRRLERELEEKDEKIGEIELVKNYYANIILLPELMASEGDNISLDELSECLAEQMDVDEVLALRMFDILSSSNDEELEKRWNEPYLN